MSTDSTHQSVLSFWQVNSRVTSYFFEHVSEDVLTLRVPGTPRKIDSR